MYEPLYNECLSYCFTNAGSICQTRITLEVDSRILKTMDLLNSEHLRSHIKSQYEHWTTITWFTGSWTMDTLGGGTSCDSSKCSTCVWCHTFFCAERTGLETRIPGISHWASWHRGHLPIVRVRRSWYSKWISATVVSWTVGGCVCTLIVVAVNSLVCFPAHPCDSFWCGVRLLGGLYLCSCGQSL